MADGRYLIHLEPPKDWGRSPDGKGWNRLSLNAHIGKPEHQCALKPLDFRAYLLVNLHSRSFWGGGFGVCSTPEVANDGCRGCPVKDASPQISDNDPAVQPDGRILVRSRTVYRRTNLSLNPIVTWDEPVIVFRPHQGWESTGWLDWTWAEIAALQGWRPVKEFTDEHSAGVWLARRPSIDNQEETENGRNQR